MSIVITTLNIIKTSKTKADVLEAEIVGEKLCIMRLTQNVRFLPGIVLVPELPLVILSLFLNLVSRSHVDGSNKKKIQLTVNNF